MTRAVILGILLLGSTIVSAQQTSPWHARIVPSAPNTSPKPLFAAVTAVLPEAHLKHDRDTQLITITTVQELEPMWLESVTSSVGFTLEGLWRDVVDIYALPCGYGARRNMVGNLPSQTRSMDR